MINGKRFILLHVYAGQETPYYYIGDKLRLAFVHIGNESVTADRIQLKALVLKGSGRTYDSLPSNYRFEDMAFSEMAVNIGVFDRQVRKYLKRMTDMKFIVREGGRKNGIWRIIDGDYEDFFERI